MTGGGSGSGGGSPIKADISANIDQYGSINANLDLAGSLDKINMTTAMNGDLLENVNLTTNSLATLAIPHPIQIIGDASIDIKPLHLDTCLRVGFEPLPSTRICRQKRRHVGVTVFGIEITGLSFSSDTQLDIEDLGSRPQVAWGGERIGPGPRRRSVQRQSSGGISIRLSD
jgi:hypothetical protein